MLCRANPKLYQQYADTLAMQYGDYESAATVLRLLMHNVDLASHKRMGLKKSVREAIKAYEKGRALAPARYSRATSAPLDPAQ
eukprot:SAG11_NODE_621_length_8169_cov_2.866914_9_plen_83_part_00